MSKAPSTTSGTRTWWRSNRNARWFPLVVLITSLVASLVAVLTVRSTARDRDRMRFNNAVNATKELIERRVDAYRTMLVATRALFTASETAVDAAQFRTFVAHLDVEHNYPGLQGVGFTQRFSWDDRPRIEAQQRASGFPRFRVWPIEDRDEVHAIMFLEPWDARNAAAQGFNMFSEPVRRAAMERARDTGTAAASGAVTLVQEIEGPKQAGFLIYLPLYRGGQPQTVEARREQLAGYVYSAFRVDDLLAGVFGSERSHRVTFSIFDGVTGGLMHHAADVRDRAQFDTSTTLDIAGYPWLLRFQSTRALEESSGTWMVPYAAGAGLAVSGLLFLLSLLQARRHQQERIHSQILDGMSEGVTVSDETGAILYANPAEDAMFGYAPGELVSSSVSVQDTYAPDEHDRIRDEIVAQLRATGAWVGELSNVKQDGTRFTTAARISALELNGRSYRVCVQEDITDRKAAERDRAASLEREQALRVAAESANRTKDQFLAMLGHELRNPIAPMVTALDLLERRGGNDVASECRVLRRQLTHMHRLVDDLLDVSELTSGTISLTRHPLELASVVDEAVAATRSIYDERRLHLEIAVPRAGLVVDGDRTRLVQILVNLLDNAAKYTPAGGRVDVIATREGERVQLRVRDTGIGIAGDVLPTLFEPFTQVDRRVAAARGGLGIGLTLVRRLVELHDGTVEAHSAGPGMGTELVVDLPACNAIVEAIETATSDLGARGKRVLIVDDNEDAADLMGEFLRDAGYDVAIAYEPKRALQLTSDFHPDAAILDIGLPEMDGYALAERLGAPRPLLIALTGFGRDEDRARSREAGFNYHFVKPASPTKILEVLATISGH